MLVHSAKEHQMLWHCHHVTVNTLPGDETEVYFCFSISVSAVTLGLEKTMSC